MYTSRKPLIKFDGSFGVGSSSVWKYFMTCESCFQKLSVSCCTSGISCVQKCDSSTDLAWRRGRGREPAAYLELLVAVEEQDIDGP
jgi:hypothetical protein